RVVFEAPQSVASVQRLQKRLPQAYVEARYPTTQVQAELFGNLYHLFSARRLRIFKHEQLKREALNLVTKTVAGNLKVVDSHAIHQDHVIALGGAAGLVLTPDTYATSMGYFSSVGSDPERQKEHQQFVDRYLAQ